MNRDLFGFAILLVLLGIGFGIYLISFFGLLLMIPAFLTRPRPKTGGTTLPVKQQVRRISPPTVRQAEPWIPTSQPLVATPAPPPAPATTPTYGVPLFPTSMFPSLTMTPAPQTSQEATTEKPTQRDELLEIGTILALLRFAFG